MDRALELLVWERAQAHCEFCHLAQVDFAFTHEIDHVIAKKHGGATTAANLALACFPCNNHNGTDLGGIDPVTRKLTRLFHPRKHKWTHHFRWEGPDLVGKTAIGRTTVAVLRMNLPDRVLLRQALIEEGVFPPTMS